MNNLARLNNENVLTIESREVAKMVEKDHSKLMRDIRTYCKYLNEAKIGLVKYFIESNYKDSKGEKDLVTLLLKWDVKW
ncbi:hypothetical protein CF091_14065 [Clostridium botulinum]